MSTVPPFRKWLPTLLGLRFIPSGKDSSTSIVNKPEGLYLFFLFQVSCLLAPFLFLLLPSETLSRALNLQSVSRSLPSSSPLASKEEAVLQAKNCPSDTLESPSTTQKKLASSSRKSSSTGSGLRFLSSMTQWFHHQTVPGIRPWRERKGYPIKILLLWRNSEAAKKASEFFL